MKRTSVKTLVLLVELLAVVAAYQFLAWSPPATAALVWLGDDDPNEVADPNAADDPQPECIGSVSWMQLDDEPEDPNDPESEGEPQPESVFRLPAA
ncbi:MAG TPA: hypothetical protein VLI39_06675 [Sedimentisphaerales bacterium]|nr:hypothetical protein [Sedimentisphaerales bacterium]